MKTTDDISLMLKDLFGETLLEIMESEMDTTLGYGKNQSAEKDTIIVVTGVVKKLLSMNLAKPN